MAFLTDAVTTKNPSDLNYYKIDKMWLNNNCYVLVLELYRSYILEMQTLICNNISKGEI